MTVKKDLESVVKSFSEHCGSTAACYQPSNHCIPT